VREEIQDWRFYERWFLLGLYGEGNWWGLKKKDNWQAEWQEELDRRRSMKLPSEEWMLIENMKLEKEFGVEWTCSKCGIEYRVKTPFKALYCFNCLRKLKSNKYLPKNNRNHGIWVLEEI